MRYACNPNKNEKQKFFEKIVLFLSFILHFLHFMVSATVFFVAVVAAVAISVAPQSVIFQNKNIKASKVFSPYFLGT